MPMTPRISLISAMTHARVIGIDNRLPWRLPADLRRFKALTLAKPIVMGRKTFISLGRPLPDRHNIVLTRTPDFVAPGCTLVADIPAALAAAGAAPEIMIIGGADLYAQMLPRAQRLYLTLIDAEIPGDAFFPAWDGTQWQEIAREDHCSAAEFPYPYSFLTLNRMAAD